MVRRHSTLRGFGKCHPNELRSSLGAWLSRRSKVLNARAAATIVDNSEQKFVLEKALFSAILKPTVDVDSTKLSGGGAGHRHGASTVLVFFRS